MHGSTACAAREHGRPSVRQAIPDAGAGVSGVAGSACWRVRPHVFGRPQTRERSPDDGRNRSRWQHLAFRPDGYLSIAPCGADSLPL